MEKKREVEIIDWNDSEGKAGYLWDTLENHHLVLFIRLTMTIIQVSSSHVEKE